MKIAINMGHTTTGTGTGAVGIVKETDKNREVGNKLISKLNEYNCTVINCTIDKHGDNMAWACNKANTEGADIFISLHLNAGGGTGVETFYYKGCSQSNINFANKVNSDLAKTSVLSPSRRCMADRDYYGYNLYVLKNTKMDAILVELGFVDNKKDTNRWDAEVIANTICNSIVGFYGLTKKQVINNQPSQNSDYTVIIDTDTLNVRAGAGTNYKINTTVTKGYKYTITETKGDWGRLKSGAGWIHLGYTKKVGEISKSINIGSKVKIIGTNYATGESVSSYAKGITHTVKELRSGDKVLLKEINSVCYLKDLKLV